ncbi:MAG TPA: hypothetical protein VLI69_09155 [Gammaproteobacteria bacterium]|nr:hypothetical protein [Gammaproteobacteria bacterium]
MKFSLPVIVKKTAAADIGESVLIPRLGIIKTLSEADKSQIENIGLKSYLEQLLLNILKRKSIENEYIELPKVIDTFVDKFVSQESKVELNSHDLILTVEVEFEIKFTRRFFSKCLPPIMKLTILIELSAGMILSIGTLQLTEDGFIPMSEDTSKAVTITQSALSTLLNLWIALSGPGMAFIENFSASMDDTLNKMCSKKTITSYVIEEEALSETKSCTSSQAKIRLVQGIFLILVINNLWTNITMDYQQISLLNTRLIDDKSSLFPAWLISAAAYIAFGFNQLNDPVMLMSLLSVGFKMISSYYTKAKPIPISATSQANHRNTLLYLGSTSQPLLGVDQSVGKRSISINNSSIDHPFNKNSQ